MTSTEYYALIERSIDSWKSINFVWKDKAASHRRCADLLRTLQSIEALLTNAQFWFFQQRSRFLAQSTLPKWDPGNLGEYILLPIDYGFVNNEDCFFVSHYWHTPQHPDPKGEDLRSFQHDLAQLDWSYVWVDFTCLPQWPRTAEQETYFIRTLTSIPMLVRDCAFEWRFPSFEPRAWILFEVGENLFSHTEHTMTEDVAPFMSHLREMTVQGVQPVMAKYGYRCTNGGDLPLVTGWLELLIILFRICAHKSDMQEILDWVNRGDVEIYTARPLNIHVDKGKGIVRHGEIEHKFTPLPFISMTERVTVNADKSERSDSTHTLIARDFSAEARTGSGS